TTFGNMGIVETVVGTGTNNSFVNKILIQNDGKIILTGNAYNGSNNDFVLIRYNNLVTNIESKEELKNSVAIYPNPNNGSFEMTIDAPFQEANLTIFDLTGKVIVQQRITQKNTQLNLLSHPKGMYFYQLMVDGKQVTGKLLIQ
ncbi:MAG: T9SS type A sorting domain-containing protein, partial [Vicingaceae bacterium]|nr:T9SS type A sorting domain-containing protein [Vicingaceae bacterium]